MDSGAFFCFDSWTVVMLQDLMIKDGSLPDFSETERVTLNLLMFSDRLPEGALPAFAKS